MVLDGFVDSVKALQSPGKLFIYGALLSTVAIFLSLWIFRPYASLVMVFLITMGCLPLIYILIKNEEEKDLTDMEEKMLLKEHGKALEAFMILFAGVTVSLAIWYAVLPGSIVGDLFKAQTEAMNAINAKVVTGITGNAINSLSAFTHIFLNNMRVLIFCVLFSFIYGAGALFILMWNASVLGNAIGNLLRTGIATAAQEIGLTQITHYFGAITYSLFRYAIHGIPEILAYFTAGLAGGIISIAVIKHDFGSRKFEHIVLDSADLLIISLILLFLAGLLEVYVTPVIF